jgi:cell division protein FtsW (lipid II flippase)
VRRAKRAVVSSPRNVELGLLLMAAIIVGGAYALVGLGRTASLPANIGPFLGTTFALIVVAHVALRRFAKKADGTLLAIAALLNGLGYVFIARLNPKLAGLQSTWTGIGIVAFVLTLWFVPRVRDLARYRYTFALIGLILLVAPVFLGTSVNGSRIWIKIGPASFQPGEVAKIVLAIFFASYLVEKRELLSMATRKIGPFRVPDIKHFGPIVIAWIVALLVLVKENDFGSSLLFFTLFITVLYVGTGRGIYILLGVLMLGVGGYGAYHTSPHVAERVHVWMDPWKDYDTSGYQIAQAQFAMASGGVPGSGLGLGDPNKIPEAATDFIFAAIGEETGLLGDTAILVAFLLFVTIGFRIAMRATNPFEKLLATGLTAIIGIQTFIIVGGVIRVVPLTGITLPFVSYGGSSLVTNYVLLALLLRLSHDQAVMAGELGDKAEDPELVA